MPEVIVGELSPLQKVEVGPAVSGRLLEKRAGDPVATGLAARISACSVDIHEPRIEAPVARDTRADLTQQMKGDDRLRDRTISALNMAIGTWLLRDDLPDKQRDAALVQTELLPDGPSFIDLGYTEQSAGMDGLLKSAANPPVAAALERLGMADLIVNIRDRQAGFVNLTRPKDDAHHAATRATERAAAAERRWDGTMRAIVNHLDSVYDRAVLEQRDERNYILQTLAAANAVVRTRQTRAKSNKGTPGTTPPAEPPNP